MLHRSKMKYRAEYSHIVEDFRKSGLNRTDYCNAHSYHPNTCDGWIKKMSRPIERGKWAKNKVKGLKNHKEHKHSVLVPLKIDDVHSFYQLFRNLLRSEPLLLFPLYFVFPAKQLQVQLLVPHNVPAQKFYL